MFSEVSRVDKSQKLGLAGRDRDGAANCYYQCPVRCIAGEKPPANSGLHHKIRATGRTGSCKFTPNDRDGKSVLAEVLSFPNEICPPAEAPKPNLRPMGGN